MLEDFRLFGILTKLKGAEAFDQGAEEEPLPRKHRAERREAKVRSFRSS
jgi:hypothetical protein